MKLDKQPSNLKNISPCNFAKYVRLNAHIQDNEEMITEIVSYDPNAFKYISERLKDNTNIVTKVIRLNFRLIKYASERLRNDFSIMSGIFEYKESEIIHCCGRNLLNDISFMLKCFEHLNTIKVWSVTPEILRTDQSFLLKIYDIVSNHRQSLSSLLVKSRNYQSRDTVLEIVHKYPGALNYVSKSWKEDDEIIQMALISHTKSIKFIRKKLSRDICLNILSRNGSLLKYFNTLYDDDEAVYLAVNNKPLMIQFASERLKEDRNILLTAFLKNESAIQYVNSIDTVRDDVIQHMNSNPNVIRFIDIHSKIPLDIIIQHIKRDPFSYLKLQKNLICIQIRRCMVKIVSEKPWTDGGHIERNKVLRSLLMKLRHEGQTREDFILFRKLTLNPFYYKIYTHWRDELYTYTQSPYQYKKRISDFRVGDNTNII